MTVARINPNTVWRTEIVADINVRQTIAIQIPQHNRKSPVIRRLRERFAILIDEGSISKRNGSEVRVSVVFVEDIRLTVLSHFTIWVKVESANQIRLGW